MELPSVATVMEPVIITKTSRPHTVLWINQVERFFALLSEQQIKRGTHRSIAELERAISSYIKTRNADPKPFRWTKSADDILASVERFCRRTISLHEQTA
jgi:hypothetical protein